jgi:hypothetical protein
MNAMRLFDYPKNPDERQVCFDVLNFEAALARDPDAILKLETQLSAEGAIPGRVDMPTRTICVLVTDPDLTDNDVVALIARYGFEVQPRKET